MPQARPRTRTRRAAVTPAARRLRLADLGVYGFDRHETTILAALDSGIQCETGAYKNIGCGQDAQRARLAKPAPLH